MLRPVRSTLEQVATFAAPVVHCLSPSSIVQNEERGEERGLQ